MADDITLTVRVRDMSRGELNRLNQQINRLRQNFRNAGQGANNTGTNFNRLGTDIDRLNQRFRRMISSGNLTRRELQDLNRDLRVTAQGLRRARREGHITGDRFRAMSRDLDMLRSRMILVGRQGNVFTRLGARTALLRDHFRRLGTSSNVLVRSFARLGDWGARGASRSLRVLGGMASVFGRIRQSLSKVSHAMWLFIAIVALVGPAAIALGALLTTVLAAGFVALGAFALRSSAQVKRAFGEMKYSLGTSLREAAAPLQDSLVKGMLQVGVAVRQMQPQLQAAFKATGPLIEDLVGAFADFSARALPGFTYALANSQKAMAGFRTAMALLGDGFGEMMRIIVGGNDQKLSDAWVMLGAELRNVLVSIGEFSSSMMNSGAATLLTIGIFRTFTGLLNLVSAAFQAIDTVLLGLPGKLANLIDNADELGRVFGKSGDATTRTITGMKEQLKDVNAQIRMYKDLLKKDDVRGPARDHIDRRINDLLTERTILLADIAAAESTNAEAVNKEARAYRDLLQAIQALADQNRGYMDALAAEHAAIDDADAALKKAAKNKKSYSNALKTLNGQLDLNATLTTKSGREAYEMLSKIASATKETTDKAIAANKPWEEVQKNWKTGYDNIVRLADGMGLTKEQAKQLATEILGIPPTKELVLKTRTEDAIASLNGVIAAMQASPSAKEISVKVLSADAQRLLEQLGFTVTQLPDGSFTITAKTGSASEKIAAVQAARDALQGKDIKMSATDAASGVIGKIQRWAQGLVDRSFTITAIHRTVFQQVGSAPSTTADALRRQAERFGKGAIGGSFAQVAKRGLASGGSVSGQLLEGPGTSTSDSIIARLSRGEFVMKAAAVQKYGLGFMQAVNSGLIDRLPGFAKGGTTSKAAKAKATAAAKAKAAAEARKEALTQARNELTLSHFGKMAGWKNPEIIGDLARADGIHDLVSGLNKWRSLIKKTTSGKTETSLLKQLDKAGKSLLKYEKKQADVNKKLDAAKEKLNGLKESAAQLKESIKSTILGETDITRSASAEDSQVTINTLLSQMSGNAGQAAAFDKALKDLQKRGLSKDLIAQIAQAGISGGGLETATAILGGNKDQIAQLNKFYATIDKSAGSAGKTAADAMYAAGIKAAEGLVKGLTAQQKAIEKAMLNIAKSMEKAIKKALGIKSPSRVMMSVGHYAAEGFAQGVLINRKPQKAVEDMITIPSPRSVSASSGAASGQPLIVQLSLADKYLGEVIIDPLRKSIRHRGGNVQAVLGK